jgi:hypothetical protein
MHLCIALVPLEERLKDSKEQEIVLKDIYSRRIRSKDIYSRRIRSKDGYIVGE